jgi:uncharacterized membrane protein
MSSAKDFFTPEEQIRIVNAITEAELHTSGEIRLHIENLCFGSELKAAQKVFHKLGMDQTAERNGVLIYIAVVSHKIAVIGDAGIHSKLGAEFWKQLVDQIISEFRKEHKADALCDAIRECGKQLGKYFPRATDDKDELTNTISY